MTWLTRVLGTLQALVHNGHPPAPTIARQPFRETRRFAAYRRGAEVTAGDLTITVKVTSTTVYELWVHRNGCVVGLANVAQVGFSLRFPSAAWVTELLMADLRWLRPPQPPEDELTELVRQTIAMIDGP